MTTLENQTRGGIFEDKQTLEPTIVLPDTDFAKTDTFMHLKAQTMKVPKSIICNNSVQKPNPSVHQW